MELLAFSRLPKLPYGLLMFFALSAAAIAAQHGIT